MALNVGHRRVFDDSEIVIICQLFHFKHELQIAYSDQVVGSGRRFLFDLFERHVIGVKLPKERFVLRLPCRHRRSWPVE
jgi:hypothetical protein